MITVYLQNEVITLFLAMLFWLFVINLSISDHEVINMGLSTL